MPVDWGVRVRGRVTPQSVVGAIRIGGIQVEVAPKISVDRVIFLLEHTRSGVRWRHDLVDVREAPSLLARRLPGLGRHLRHRLSRLERLSTDLANLRERLRHAAGAGRQVNPVVRACDGYRLVPGLLEVDWWGVLDDCRHLTSRADGAEPLPDQEVVLRRLVAAFEGGVLADGAGYEWLAGLQERSRRTGIAVHRKLAAILSRSGRREAASVLDRACDLDPFDEDLARQAIIAHRACGDEAAASARWEVLRAALAELGEIPTAVTAVVVHGAASG